MELEPNEEDITIIDADWSCSSGRKSWRTNRHRRRSALQDVPEVLLPQFDPLARSSRTLRQRQDESATSTGGHGPRGAWQWLVSILFSIYRSPADSPNNGVEVQTPPKQMCRKTFTIQYEGELAVKNHLKTGGQRENQSALQGCSLMSSFVIANSSEADKVTINELAFVYHNVQHQLSYNSLDCGIKLTNQIFKDSTLSKLITLGLLKIISAVRVRPWASSFGASAWRIDAAW